ncbi:MAG: ABC transporter permease subunit [Provencibacterium sp.]|jgi:hypothetical protein|nr:ABC transporter permease subunit [Provencibacterium sp.]
MSFLSLLHIELLKLRRSKIGFILLAAAFFLWLPATFNVQIYFDRTELGIPPEQNFFIQGFLGLSWFMFPASMVICTVLLMQLERGERGLFKMLSLPVNAAKLCLAKFFILLALAVFMLLFSAAAYCASAALIGANRQYPFVLPLSYVLSRAGILLLAALPMLTFFWLLSVCIPSPLFSAGIGLFSIVPAVLAMNTKIWYLYPMCYPFYIMTAEYGRLADGISTWQVSPFPLLPVAILFSAACLTISCLRFGKSETN